MQRIKSLNPVAVIAIAIAITAIVAITAVLTVTVIVASISPANAYAAAYGNTDTTYNNDYKIMQRWTQAGVLPYVEYENFDKHITHLGFADIMHNLIAFDMHERLLFNSGLSYILRYEAEAILTYALGQAVGQIIGQTELGAAHNNPLDFLSFRQLLHLLDDYIQLFLTDEFNINLLDIPLETTLLINQLHSDSEFELSSVLSNIRGSGDVVIVPREGSHIELRNVNITGNIIIVAAYGSVGVETGFNLSLQNSYAAGLYVLGQAAVTFIGDNHIENIAIKAPASIDTWGLSRQATEPSVFSNTADIALKGYFNEVYLAVQNSFAPALIVFDGSAESLQAHGGLIVLGNANITSYDALAIQFINEEALYRQMHITDSIEEIMTRLITQMLEQLEPTLARQQGQGQGQTGDGQIQDPWYGRPPFLPDVGY